MADKSIKLIASSADGKITTLSLSQSDQNAYTLKPVAIRKETSSSPSFLFKHSSNGKIYCGFEKAPSSIASYSLATEGELDLIERVDTLGGSCHQITYNREQALAVAEYDASGISTWKIEEDGHLLKLQQFTFTMETHGPKADRQEAPHPHQVLTDPTDSFLVVLDLGADLIRVFRIEKADSTLTEKAAVTVPPGSGPRHGAFLHVGGKTYFYLVTELLSTLIVYEVTYEEESLGFTQRSIQSIYGSTVVVPEGAYACDVAISPDNRFLITCSRLDYKFQISNFDQPQSGKIPSDTMQVWSIDGSTGEPHFQQLSACGGMNPRHFSLSKSGCMAAIALIGDGRVVIVERSIADGSLGKFIAHAEGLGEVMCVIWDD